MLRCKTLNDLRRLGLRLDPNDPTKAIPAGQAPAASSEAVTEAQDGPIVGPNIDALIALGTQQWRKIKDTEKYLTGAHYDFGRTLQAIKEWYGDDDRAWARAYRRIGVPKQRVSEFIRYPQVFSSREKAANCSVPEANKKIRTQTQEDNKEKGTNYNEFETPQWFFDLLDAEFHFGLDAAATPEVAKCKTFIVPEEDALIQDWVERSGGKPVFRNPPWNRQELGQWVEKGFAESQRGPVVVMIVPQYVSYGWFRWIVARYAEIRQTQGLVLFRGFGAMKTKAAGVNPLRIDAQRIDVVAAIFRPGQRYAFLGPYIDKPKGDVPEKPDCPLPDWEPPVCHNSGLPEQVDAPPAVAQGLWDQPAMTFSL